MPFDSEASALNNKISAYDDQISTLEWLINCAQKRIYTETQERHMIVAQTMLATDQQGKAAKEMELKYHRARNERGVNY